MVPKLSPEAVSDLVARRERGWSVNRLAAHYGVSPGTVRYHCLANGAASPKARPLPNRGPMVFRTKDGRVTRRFTPAEDALMRDLSLAGIKAPTIAKRLQRPRTSVNMRLLALAMSEPV